MTKKVANSRNRQVSKSAKRSVRVKRSVTRDSAVGETRSPKNQSAGKNPDQGSIEEETLDRDAPYNKTYGIE